MKPKEKLNQEVLNNRSQIPEILYRAFAEQKNARDFREQGLFRMGSPEYYGKIEDKNRRDANEGKGLINIQEPVDVVSIDAQGKIVVMTKPGIMEHQSINANCKVLLCCSGPKVGISLLKTKFGPYIVKINEPLRLAQDVTAWLQKEGIQVIGEKAEWIKVRYNKGQTVKESFTSEQFAELSYSQKDPEFSSEDEYRLVVTMADITMQDNDDEEFVYCEDFLYVNLGRKLDYVEYVM